MRLHVEDSSKTKGEFENVDKVEMVNISKNKNICIDKYLQSIESILLNQNVV